MAHRSKELMRAALDELERHGAEVTGRGTDGGSHQYVTYVHGGNSGILRFPFSPHSSATSFVRQKVRRQLRSP